MQQLNGEKDKKVEKGINPRKTNPKVRQKSSERDKERKKSVRETGGSYRLSLYQGLIDSLLIFHYCTYDWSHTLSHVVLSKPPKPIKNKMRKITGLKLVWVTRCDQRSETRNLWWNGFLIMAWWCMLGCLFWVLIIPTVSQMLEFRCSPCFSQ